MHRCLIVDEILVDIGGFILGYSFAGGPGSSCDRKSLLAFVLTCRTFAEPGLSVLWRHLDNIYPLAYAFGPKVDPVIDTAAAGRTKVRLCVGI